jgi:hypothetical protein
MSGLAEENETMVTAAKRCAALELANQQYINYIMEKTNQLLRVMGTECLQPDALEEGELLALDPIGIIADSMAQIMNAMEENQQKGTDPGEHRS